MAASIGLAGGFAVAQGQEQTEEYELDEDIVTETPRESDTYDPSRDIVTDEDRTPDMSLGESQSDSPINTDYGSVVPGRVKVEEGAPEDAELMRAQGAELEGQTVLTLDGEEVGQIRQVGRNPEDGQRVATIDAGGFLGVDRRTIAIPLAKMSRAEPGSAGLRVYMMRTSLEVEPEFDESRLAPDS